jgi:hypothetical protein
MAVGVGRPLPMVVAAGSFNSNHGVVEEQALQGGQLWVAPLVSQQQLSRGQVRGVRVTTQHTPCRQVCRLMLIMCLSKGRAVLVQERERHPVQSAASWALHPLIVALPIIGAHAAAE